MQPLLRNDPEGVEDYRLLGRLGKGSMGSVYLGRSRGGRVVAVKVVRTDLAEDAEFRERFRREVAMARSVGGFWTAAVVDADPDAAQPWLATEYVPGPTLHKAVSDHGPLPESSARTLAAGLAEALRAVHRAGLVHRDLKPANVLLGSDGPRVIDFGISRAMEGQSLTATGMFLGTPGYFSPEQTTDGEISPASDVFSLGAVLTFATSGHGPFGTENTAAMLYGVVHNDPDLSGVPEGLRPLLAACLAKDPAARPTTDTLLDRLGGPEARTEWLPPAINAEINEHTTQLQNTAGAPQPPPPAPPQWVPASTGARMPTGTRKADWSAAGSDIGPARANGTAQPNGTTAGPPPAAEPPGPAVREDDPGPVFRTAGRLKALVWAVIIVAVIIGCYRATGYVIQGLHYRWLPGGQKWFLYGMNVLGVIAVLLALRAVWPPLHLKVNSGGLRISRTGIARELPWQRIRRVGVVGRGKSQKVAVWLTDSAPRPRSRWWHWVSRYHGGYLVFPIGSRGRREIKRIRLGLEQYAGGRYDNRLL